MNTPSVLLHRRIGSSVALAAAILAATVLGRSLVKADVAAAAAPTPFFIAKVDAMTCDDTNNDATSHTNRRNLSRPPSSKADLDPVYPQQEQRCLMPSVPPEHLDGSCDVASQNACLNAEVTNSWMNRDNSDDDVYLNMPEEKTWICPLDGDATEGTAWAEERRLGRSTRWVVSNRASSPVIITRVDARGVEVPATTIVDDDNESKSSSTAAAVWPRGPILLPGSMAVVEGRQGQSFVVREYEEILLVSSPNKGGPFGPSLRESLSVDDILPRTLSFLPPQAMFKTNDGALRLSGRPGRVLMRHRMGNLYIRNSYGGVCPLVLYDHDDGIDAYDDEEPHSLRAGCNALTKAFINKVGCPIDIYFTTEDTRG